MKFKEFTTGMRHAANLGHALGKAGLVTRIIIADQAALPGP